MYFYSQTGSKWNADGSIGFSAFDKTAHLQSWALYGSTVVCGAQVFSKVGSAWQQSGTLSLPPGVGFGFGHSEALDANTIVIGDPYDFGAGRAYIYSKVRGRWQLSASLLDPQAAMGNHFGWAVAIEGSTVVVGAMSAAGASGRVYVFSKAGNAWRLEGTLQGEPSIPGSQFGHSVAIAGSRLLVGSDNGAYVYQRTPRGWLPTMSLHDSLMSSNTRSSTDAFGYSVALSGGSPSTTTFVVGAPSAMMSSAVPPPGAVHVYSFAPTTPTGQTFTLRQTVLEEPHGAAGDAFGWSVAIAGSTLLVAAPPVFVTSGQVPPASVAFVYTRSATGWNETGELVPPYLTP